MSTYGTVLYVMMAASLTRLVASMRFEFVSAFARDVNCGAWRATTHF